MNYEELLNTLLQEIGLTDHEIQIYRLLFDRGQLSIFQISKVSKIPRTTAYRVVEDLVTKGLVELMPINKNKLYKAVDFRALKEKFYKKEKVLEEIKDKLVDMESHFAVDQTLSSLGTQVTFYNGKERVMQLVWKQLNGKDRVSFEYLTYSDLLGSKFARDFSVEDTIRGNSLRELIADNDIYLTPDHIKQYREDETGYKFYDWRYLPAKKFPINHTISIFDETVMYITVRNREYIGVEIKDREIATLQRSIFDTLWDAAVTPEDMLARLERGGILAHKD